MKAEDIIPRLNYVVVERVEASTHTAGGLALPENVAEAQNITVRVVSVGPGTWSENGDRIPMDLQPGDYAVMAPSPIFFEIPGLPGVGMTADDAIVATVPAHVAMKTEFKFKVLT